MKQVPTAIRKVYPAVIAPGINQANGQWRDDGRCCVGARLAHALGVETGNFLDGADAWARELGGNRVHVILMLRRAGAGREPLGPEEWHHSPREVWANLSEEEELPLLAGADLLGSDLRAADLRGADLRNAVLREADLTGANLAGANLAGADLREACLDGANLDQATLDDTTLVDSQALPSRTPVAAGLA